MNRLVRNKKRAKLVSKGLGHKIKYFYMFCGFALSRCIKCGAMIYVSGRYMNHLYGEEFSGDATKLTCC